MVIMSKDNFVTDDLPICPKCGNSMRCIRSEPFVPPSGSSYSGGTANPDEAQKYQQWKEYECPNCKFSYEDYE